MSSGWTPGPLPEPAASGTAPAGPPDPVEAPESIQAVEPGEAAIDPEGPGRYRVRLLLQRGPYPYDARISVVAAVDVPTIVEEGTPDWWRKAIVRANKEAPEVGIFELSLDEQELLALFATAGFTLGRPAAPEHYNVRLAVELREFREGDALVVVAALDEQTAESIGVVLDGPLRTMPVGYRRGVNRSLGELREVIVSVPLEAVERRLVPPPTVAVLCVTLAPPARG